MQHIIIDLFQNLLEIETLISFRIVLTVITI